MRVRGAGRSPGGDGGEGVPGVARGGGGEGGGGGATAGGRAEVAGQGLGWQRTIAVAYLALEHMAEDVVGMTSESNGRAGRYSFDALRGIEGLG